MVYLCHWQMDLDGNFDGNLFGCVWGGQSYGIGCNVRAVYIRSTDLNADAVDGGRGAGPFHLCVFERLLELGRALRGCRGSSAQGRCIANREQRTSSQSIRTQADCGKVQETPTCGSWLLLIRKFGFSFGLDEAFDPFKSPVIRLNYLIEIISCLRPCCCT